MKVSWRSFFGFASDENPDETYDEAVVRAKKLLREENYEDACRILKYAERQQHPEAMYLLAWCCWKGVGVREDAGRAEKLWKQSAEMGYEPAVERCQEMQRIRDEFNAENH